MLTINFNKSQNISKTRMNSFIEINGEILFLHRLRHYAKQGRFEVVQHFYQQRVGIMADAVEGAIEGGHLKILRFAKDVGFVSPRDILTR